MALFVPQLTALLALVRHSFLIDLRVHVLLLHLHVHLLRSHGVLDALQFDHTVTLDVLHVGHVLATKTGGYARLTGAVEVFAGSFVRYRRRDKGENRKCYKSFRSFFGESF